MELSSDLVSIQGIFTSLIKNTGEFTKINYRGGNEQKILDILVEIEKFLIDKKYLMKDLRSINPMYKTELENIVFFLTLNTSFKSTLNFPEYSHLMNIMPQLSKCLLVNLVTGLELSQFLCLAMCKLPMENSVEILDEINQILRFASPNVHLENASLYLSTVCDVLSSVELNNQTEEMIDRFIEVSNIILQNLTSFNPDKIKNWTQTKIYQHMGFTLLKLFDLLLQCDKNKDTLAKFIQNVVATCCSLIKNVTLSVFCSWAEISVDDERLQNTISGKAYSVMEEYQKHSSAKELILMLASIAKKPKSLTEQIQEADMATMIKKINKNDMDQKRWFQALLNTPVLNNQESIECVYTYSHLCTTEDVTRLLHLSHSATNDQAKKMVIKCAGTLQTEDLLLATIRYFCTYGFSNILFQNIEPQLMLLFNKLSENRKLEESLVKDVNLLLLQNPQFLFKFVYLECLKNSFYTTALREVFVALSDISKVDDYGLKIFNDVMDTASIHSQNNKYFVDFFNTMLEIQYFTNAAVLMKILYKKLTEQFQKKAFEELNFTLKILSDINVRIPIKEETKNLIKLFFSIMGTCRCKFLEFELVRQENVEQVVNIITKKCDRNMNSDFIVPNNSDDDNFTTYYKNCLLSGKEKTIFKHLIENFDINNYAECVSRLIQVLPSCITSEWLSISTEIYKKCGYEKSLELFTDVLILLCQVVQSQSPEDELFISISAALKYCLTHYGMTLQKITEVFGQTDVEICIAKNVCRLLRKLPEEKKLQEGLTLVNIITERSLKTLANDKEFVCLLVSIENSQICQVIAQRMTS